MIPISNYNPGLITQSQFYQIKRLIENYRLNMNITEFHLLTYDEAYNLINELLTNQKDPVTEKGKYNMSELNNHIRKIMGFLE